NTTDEAWVQAMLDVEVALAKAQAGLGVIPVEAADVIARAATADRVDLIALAAGARGAANPVVLLVKALTAEVARLDPAAAEFVHRGGTSQDILDSAAMLVTDRVFAEVETDLQTTAAALARLADEHRATPMAGRTLTQHAVPITFGLKASGWLTLVLDASVRVRALRASGLPAQLGGAGGTFASYVEYAGREPKHAAELSARFAAELGLTEAVVPWHALRTPLADIGSVCAFVTVALGKPAVDVQGMSRTEVGEVAEPAAEGRGVSSAMPQKRNPVLATMLIAAARQIPLYATVLTQSMVAEDERAPGAWHAEWQPLRECLRTTGGAAATAAELAAGLEVFPEALRANLERTRGAIVAERVAVALAPELGKASAKDLLARVSADGRPFADAVCAELDTHSLDVGDLLDPAGYLGAADLLVSRALARYEQMR
ncbi:MAG TPA: adenylosuccinate lyase family protein, partial [Amycolatopsis sp.]|nr:adenylosuccinate lyase family protein [Amycolatopsis sp.]